MSFIVSVSDMADRNLALFLLTNSKLLVRDVQQFLCEFCKVPAPPSQLFWQLLIIIITNNMKNAFQSKADHPRTGYTDTLFMLLWPWPWPWSDDLDIRTRPEDFEDVSANRKMNFLGQCFQKLEHYRQTDRDRRETHRQMRPNTLPFAGGNINAMKTWPEDDRRGQDTRGRDEGWGGRQVAKCQRTVASPGFVARRGKDGNYVMGHHEELQGRVQQLLDD